MIPEKVINALKWIIEILNRKQIPYQISGGFAAHLYGATRPINDIDIDIPEDSFLEIINEVRSFIIDELQQYKDEKWDLQIMTLDYHGQEIDISGAYNGKVSNKQGTQWVPVVVDFSSSQKINVKGIVVNVASPEKMIEYKQHLNGDHQIEDIKAMQHYIESNN
jgi:hypothetical protein